MPGPADPVAVVAALRRAGLTVAAAESLTAGLLCATLADVPGASAVLRGGLVVYATDLKHRLAGVPQPLLDERGPVDPAVAVALAEGARSACRADLGVGLTGVAGPDPQDGHPPGTWFVALVGADGVLGTAAGEPGPAPRQVVRRAAADAALGLLLAAGER